MKQIGRPILMVFVLLLGGISGYKLLPGFEPVKILIFVFVCLVLGKLSFEIDNKIRNK